jgi:hypothetical protein
VTKLNGQSLAPTYVKTKQKNICTTIEADVACKKNAKIFVQFFWSKNRLEMTLISTAEPLSCFRSQKCQNTTRGANASNLKPFGFGVIRLIGSDAFAKKYCPVDTSHDEVDLKKNILYRHVVRPFAQLSNKLLFHCGKKLFFQGFSNVVPTVVVVLFIESTISR